MDIICNVLVIFATIDMAIFAVEEGRTIYRRYQAKKDLEAFAEWAKKCGKTFLFSVCRKK